MRIILGAVTEAELLFAEARQLGARGRGAVAAQSSFVFTLW